MSLLWLVAALVTGCDGGGTGDSLAVARRNSSLVIIQGRPYRLAGGLGHSLYATPTGSVWSWGTNTSGQLGDGTNVQRLSPTQVVGLTDMTAVAAGNNHSLSLKSDGTVWSWGGNGDGQLGEGTTTQRLTAGPGVGAHGRGGHRRSAASTRWR